MCSSTMQDEHLGLWSFHILFGYGIKQETIIPHLIKPLLKALRKIKFQNFSCFLEEKCHSKQVQMQQTPSKCQRYREDFNYYQHATII